MDGWVIACIICVIILIVYIMGKCNKPEGAENKKADDLFAKPYTDDKYPRTLMKGKYGGVPVYIYDDSDDRYAAQWRKVDSGIYLQNSKTYWMRGNGQNPYD